MDTQQKIIDKLIDYIDTAILKNSVSNRQVASVLAFLNEELKNKKVDIEELAKVFLRKDKAEQTEYLLKLLGGAEIRGGLNVTGGADIDYLRVLETISAKLVDAMQVNATNVTASEQVTTLNLLVQALAETYDLNVSHVATMMRTIIKDYVSSEAFTPGLTGEGFKISKALNGDWNLEIDNIVVRKVMTIFEMVISKVRSVNGGLVISPANGRIKSVAETTGSPAYYVIGIEGDMQFVVDDYVRCQVFSNGHAKYYWVRVSSISNNSILVLKSEFTNGAVPAIGDDLVQMGNKTNKARQGVIYLTASEDGKPRISVMDGVNSTSTVGKNKVILGCLDGVTDTDFPADFQPSGYGLYAMNVFLKGVFVLRSGKTVESELTTTNAAVTAAKQIADAAKELANSANALLSDIASDNKLTPSEKQATKKEWEQIVSEKVKNDASADKYGVSKVACTTAYNALSVYITPLLASLTTTSDIVGTMFRSTFKAYYDARADLLNSISAKAKDLADAAQGKATEAANAAATAQAKANEANTAAGAAQSTADGAVTNAATANSLLSDIANDNKFTATEKQQTKKEWDVIVSEKPLNNASAVKFYVSTAAYDTAYNALNTYITPLLASLSTTSNIVGSTFRSTFKAYYDARTNLLNAVSEKAKRLTDDAQNAANAAQAKADTVTTSLQTFLAGGGLFESKITEVKEYADGKVNALQVGGRNLYLNSDVEMSSNAYNIGRKNYSSYERRKGVQYTITMCYTLGANNTYIGVYQNFGTNVAATFSTKGDRVLESKTFISTSEDWLSSTIVAGFFQFPNGQFGSKIHWVTIVEGNKGLSTFAPAPEDITADAQAKANAAQAAAEAVAIAKATLAKTEASAYADGIVTAEEQRAIADAKAKYDAALLDATRKADAAKAAAISDAASKYPTKSEVTSSITQTANEINLSVTEKIEGVQVGGRNLLERSSSEKTGNNEYLNYANTTSCFDKFGPGQYVISFEAKTSKNGSIHFYSKPGVDSDFKYVFDKSYNFPSTTEYIRRSFVVDVRISNPSRANSALSFYCVYGTGVIPTVRNVKIERGNKGTDWTPAPEDVAADAQAKANAAQAAAEAVAIAKATLAKTEASAYADGIVTAEEQRAIADAKAKYDAALLDATRKADAAKAAAISDAASKYPTKTELSSSIEVLNGRINLKVAQSDFDSLGRRVGLAESAITQQADQITAQVTKVNDLTGRVDKAELALHPDKIWLGLTAKVDGAIESKVKTGISISGNEVNIFGTTILNGNLIAGIISATNITTGRLTVTDGAKIGGMVIENNVLKGSSMILTDGAKIGDLYVVGGAFSSLNTNIIPPGTSWFSMSKDSLSYSSYSHYDYSMHSCRITGGGVNIDNGSIVVKNANGTALDVQGSIITRPGSGEERTGKNLDFMISGVWVGSNKYDIILQVTNGLITSYRLQ